MDDYFGDAHQDIELSDGMSPGQTPTNDNYSIQDQPVAFAARERLVPRQTYSQNQVIQGQNKSIVLNDGKTDRLIIGYAQGAF